MGLLQTYKVGRSIFALVVKSVQRYWLLDEAAAAAAIGVMSSVGTSNPRCCRAGVCDRPTLSSAMPAASRSSRSHWPPASSGLQPQPPTFTLVSTRKSFSYLSIVIATRGWCTRFSNRSTVNCQDQQTSNSFRAQPSEISIFLPFGDRCRALATSIDYRHIFRPRRYQTSSPSIWAKYENAAPWDLAVPERAHQYGALPASIRRSDPRPAVQLPFPARRKSLSSQPKRTNTILRKWKCVGGTGRWHELGSCKLRRWSGHRSG